jgi:hypothetical protein
MRSGCAAKVETLNYNTTRVCCLCQRLSVELQYFLVIKAEQI